MVLIIVYRAFLLETDVPDIGLDRFYLFSKERGFSSCLIVSGEEFKAIAAPCLNERRIGSVLGLDRTTCIQRFPKTIRSVLNN